MTEQQKLTFTALQQRLDSLMLRDRLRFSRRLHGVKKVKNPDAQQAIFQEMAKEIDQAAGKVLLREAARPEITYPDNLPVSQKKQDILEAIRDHQVVIVAGETGSGKTTQLPKICMELGRGIKGLIGHTQPRRLAARTVANRIAEELKTEPGGCIGYKVRFSDHVSDNTMVKLMTDGILLAEIQQDRLLMQYDTIIIDEAHHASAETYQKVLSYFKPEFTLGLTATPERADDKDILEIFRNTAHKLDIQTAVEIGELVPVRCIRIHTNIDLTKVRFNSVQYNIRDLESKIYVPERNTLIVDTYMEYVSKKRTVIFCASVRHAEQIAAMIRERGGIAYAVSGSMKPADRKEILARFSKGEIKALCACDLLNEGWDCPETEVLFMARPTMSKVLYTQQLGRGMRLADGKECLMVFDFVDNASQYNMPYSLHRLFRLKDYQPGKMVLGTRQQKAADSELYSKGEKPEAIVDYPVSATDYEAVDIFNWQEEAAGMISQMEFIRRVDVQSETVERYIREGMIIPDLIVPMSEHRVFRYFKEETLEATARQYGWRLINDENRKLLFMDMVRQMDMSYSYKPVLLKAVLAKADSRGKVRLDDISAYFRDFYEQRRSAGLVVEKPNSIFTKGGYTDKEAQRNILANPFKRFEDMQMMRHTKTLGIIEVEPTVWKTLTQEEKDEIITICNEKLMQYYSRFS